MARPGGAAPEVRRTSISGGAGNLEIGRIHFGRFESNAGSPQNHGILQVAPEVRRTSISGAAGNLEIGRIHFGRFESNAGSPQNHGILWGAQAAANWPVAMLAMPPWIKGNSVPRISFSFFICLPHANSMSAPPQVRPPPKPTTSVREPGPTLPWSCSSLRTRGMLAAEVLPYS